MARNLFGGTTSDVAEDVDGGRIPGAVGTVWNGPSTGATQVLDLTDSDGAPIAQLVADNRGFISAFYGPNNVERLWVDFGNGKMGLLSTTVGERLVAHQGATDPHQDRAYVNEQLVNYMRTSGGSYTMPVGADYFQFIVPTTADFTGSAWKLKDAANVEYTRVKNSGTVLIDTVGVRAGLAIGAPSYPASQTVINVTNSKADTNTAQSVFQVMGDGSVISKSTVTATNVGTARVFSGPNAPAAPQAGDVWIKYG